MLTEPIVQIAYFTDDVRSAALTFSRTTGAGPFFVLDRIPLSWGEHRGEPNTFVHSSAYGQWGALMVEFVHQDEEGPSPFRDLYSPGQGGLHHVAMMVPSLKDAYQHFAEHGYELAARAETVTGTEFAFVDATDSLGHMIEIYERSEVLLGFYEMVRAAAEGWRGEEPLRSLG